MTKDDASLLEAKIMAGVYRALWIQGASVVAIIGTIIGIATALGCTEVAPGRTHSIDEGGRGADFGASEMERVS